MPFPVTSQILSKLIGTSATLYPLIFSMIKESLVEIGFLVKGPWFSFAHTDNEGGASFGK